MLCRYEVCVCDMRCVCICRALGGLKASVTPCLMKLQKVSGVCVCVCGDKGLAKEKYLKKKKGAKRQRDRKREKHTVPAY